MNYRKHKFERPTPCLHRCKKPSPSTVFLRFHPFKPGYEIRQCPDCRRLSAYPTGEQIHE